MSQPAEMRLIEVKLTKYTLILTEAELGYLLAGCPAIWQNGIQRGKAARRAQAAEKRRQTLDKKKMEWGM